MPSKMQENYLGEKCNQCNDGVLKEPENNQEWYVVCSSCNALHLVYNPLPHQQEFHADNAKIKMFAGGYG